MSIKFNHNMFSKNLNDAYFEVIEQKRANPDISCRIETNVNDETVKVYIIRNKKIIKNITFKGGNRNDN